MLFYVAWRSGITLENTFNQITFTFLPVLAPIKYFFLIASALLSAQLSAQDMLRSVSGKVHFVSDAPLELIEAETESVRALIDPDKLEFAVTIPIESFMGFNSPLQQQHFYENYMETDKFLSASFAGKILGDLSYSTDTLSLTAKGKMAIHGKEVSRIIPVKGLWLSEETLVIYSRFSIRLDDHNIDIPRVVYQKIAEEIRVNFECVLRAE